MQAFVVSDFSVRLVAENSHSLKPMIYPVAGTWGNHEGSMMLWMLILTLYGALVALFEAICRPLRARVLAVQATISVAFLTFILLTSNPFIRFDPRRSTATTSIRCCRILPASPSALPLSSAVMGSRWPIRAIAAP